MASEAGLLDSNGLTNIVQAETRMGMKSRLVLALGLTVVAANAQAFSGNLGNDPPDGTYKYSVAKGQSTDTIKFSLSTQTEFDFKLFSSFTSGGPVTGTFSLYDTNSPTPVDTGSYSSTVPSFTSLDLSKGKYYFSISDFATKPVVNPLINLTVSAVPEPQTYAMMLAGLAVVAVTFRRRRTTAYAP